MWLYRSNNMATSGDNDDDTGVYDHQQQLELRDRIGRLPPELRQMIWREADDQVRRKDLLLRERWPSWDRDVYRIEWGCGRREPVHEVWNYFYRNAALWKGPLESYYMRLAEHIRKTFGETVRDSWSEKRFDRHGQSFSDYTLNVFRQMAPDVGARDMCQLVHKRSPVKMSDEQAVMLYLIVNRWRIESLKPDELWHWLYVIGAEDAMFVAVSQAKMEKIRQKNDLLDEQQREREWQRHVQMSIERGDLMTAYALENPRPGDPNWRRRQRTDDVWLTK